MPPVAFFDSSRPAEDPQMPTFPAPHPVRVPRERTVPPSQRKPGEKFGMAVRRPLPAVKGALRQNGVIRILS